MKVSEAVGGAVAACIAAIGDKSRLDEARERMGNLIDLHCDLQEVGVDFFALAHAAEFEIIERFVSIRMPRQHAEFFAGVPLEWMRRAAFAVAHGRERLAEINNATREVEMRRADAAIGWVLDSAP